MDTSVMELESEVATLVDHARSLVVTTPDLAQDASDLINGWKDLRKKIVEHHKPIKQATDRAHTAACEAEKKLLAPVDEAIRLASPKLAAYLQEVERIRRQEELAAQEAARKADEDARMAEALAAERSGEPEVATAILDLPPAQTPVVVAYSAPKVAGSALRESWEAEVTDLRLLCRAVADGLVPIQAIEANMTVLNGLARAMKSTLSYPGVRAKKNLGLSKAGR